MNENHGPLLPDYEVRAAGQGFEITPVSYAYAAKNGRNCLLRTCPPAPDPGHDLASLLLGMDISHDSNAPNRSTKNVIRNCPPFGVNIVVAA